MLFFLYLAKTFRMSELILESPRMPDLWLSISLIFLIGILSCSLRWMMIPGSIEPHLVPIGRPSRGVKPMLVSKAFPLREAVIEEPLPRWQEMMRFLLFFVSNFRACFTT